LEENIDEFFLEAVNIFKEGFMFEIKYQEEIGHFEDDMQPYDGAAGYYQEINVGQKWVIDVSEKVEIVRGEKLVSSAITKSEAERMILEKLDFKHKDLIYDFHVKKAIKLMNEGYDFKIRVIEDKGHYENVQKEITREVRKYPANWGSGYDGGDDPYPGEPTVSVGTGRYETVKVWTIDVPESIEIVQGDKLTSSPLEKVGGIDMNNINVNRQGTDSKIQFDPSAIEPLLNMNIEGFVPVIINITPLPSVLPLLGLEPRNEERPIDSAQANSIQELSFVGKYCNKFYRKTHNA